MRTLTLISVVALCALAAGGCGDDDDDDSGGGGSSAEQTGGAYGGGGSGSGGGGAQTLKLSADPGGALKFDKSSLTAKSGKVTVVMDNPSDLPHAVEVEGQGVEKAGDMADQRTGGQHGEQIDRGVDIAQERTGEGDTQP